MCMGYIFGVSGVQPAYQGAPLTFGINTSNPSKLLLEQCEIMIVNIYEGNGFGKINSPPSCSLFAPSLVKPLPYVPCIA